MASKLAITGFEMDKEDNQRVYVRLAPENTNGTDLVSLEISDLNNLYAFVEKNIYAAKAPTTKKGDKK